MGFPSIRQLILQLERDRDSYIFLGSSFFLTHLPLFLCLRFVYAIQSVRSSSITFLNLAHSRRVPPLAGHCCRHAALAGHHSPPRERPCATDHHRRRLCAPCTPVTENHRRRVRAPSAAAAAARAPRACVAAAPCAPPLSPCAPSRGPAPPAVANPEKKAWPVEYAVFSWVLMGRLINHLIQLSRDARGTCT